MKEFLEKSLDALSFVLFIVVMVFACLLGSPANAAEATITSSGKYKVYRETLLISEHSNQDQGKAAAQKLRDTCKCVVRLDQPSLTYSPATIVTSSSSKVSSVMPVSSVAASSKAGVGVSTVRVSKPTMSGKDGLITIIPPDKISSYIIYRDSSTAEYDGKSGAETVVFTIDPPKAGENIYVAAKLKDNTIGDKAPVVE